MDEKKSISKSNGQMKRRRSWRKGGKGEEEDHSTVCDVKKRRVYVRNMKTSFYGGSTQKDEK